MIVEASELGDGIRLLTFNRPPANAISKELNDGLFEQCRAAREDKSVRAVILTGHGPFFSGGMDLKEASTGGGRIGNFGRGESDGLFALWTLPKPTVAMVNGHAIAGGVIFELACDFRVTWNGPHKFGLNEVAIGLAFPIGAFEIARLALDNRQLRYALLEAGIHDVNWAREMGLVDEVTSSKEALQPRCIETARKLAALGPAAYAHTKAAIQREAVERVKGEPAEQLAARNAVFTNEETQARLRTQVAALTKKG